STNWRYCVMRKSVPNNAKNVMVIAPLAALNLGFLKKLRSSIGLDVLRSHRRNAARTTPPMVKPRRIGPWVQPCDGASMIAHSSAVIPAIDRTAPIGSSFDAAGSFDSGTNAYPATNPITTIGTLTRKIEPHQK